MACLKLKSFQEGEADWGETVKVDVELKNFDALLLTGGVMNPDKLHHLLRFIMAHRLMDADVVRGRKVTSYPSKTI